MSIVADSICSADRGLAEAQRSSVNASGASDGVSALTARGGLYLGLRYGLGILVSLGNMFVLTRWIGPHAYGLFVTALGLTSFLAALARGGVDTFLVRQESIPTKRAF